MAWTEKPGKNRGRKTGKNRGQTERFPISSEKARKRSVCPRFPEGHQHQLPPRDRNLRAGRPGRGPPERRCAGVHRQRLEAHHHAERRRAHRRAIHPAAARDADRRETRQPHADGGPRGPHPRRLWLELKPGTDGTFSDFFGENQKTFRLSPVFCPRFSRFSTVDVSILPKAWYP